ncbi:hypothetical protein ACRDNQ_07195 [Palleronia sp. KMU-117]|uniref:hypothetical protein n=1 Tax=Palleronia sp. KMU-117 TaxID=3434108 RepID=UPI003D7140E4
MKNNVLPFPARPAVSAASVQGSRQAEIVRLDDFRKRSRCLRLATGVYYVARLHPNPEDLSAA